MLIRCINRPFRDLACKQWREVGDEWEADEARLKAINSAGYGIMAEAVDGSEGGSAPEADAPTSDELEAMAVKQLVELCAVHKVETPSKPRKDDLVAALKEHFGLE